MCTPQINLTERVSDQCAVKDLKNEAKILLTCAQVKDPIYPFVVNE